MARITFIGAGSFGFTRTLVRDLLTFPLLKDATLVLMDIDKDRLAYIKKAVDLIVEKGGYPAAVEATVNLTAMYIHFYKQSMFIIDLIKIFKGFLCFTFQCINTCDIIMSCIHPAIPFI